MSFLDDAISGIKERITVAINNTFVSSFVITWCIHNWRILTYLLMSDPNLTIHSRIEKINELLISSWDSLWMPLIVAIVSTFFYPWLKFLVRFYNLEVLKHEKEITVKLGSHEIMPQDEANQLREKNSELESNVSSLKNQVLNLNERISKITNEVQDTLIKNKLDYIQFDHIKIQNISNTYPSNVGGIKKSILELCSRDLVLTYSEIKESKYFSQYKVAMETLIGKIKFNQGSPFPQSVSPEVKMYLTEKEIININDNYTLTPIGEAIYNLYINDTNT